MSVIDFHSHILPGIDDGSKNIDTSVQMLQESRAQGVDIMIATPHFYASRNRIEIFLENRKKAFETLEKHMPQMAPKIRLGAEVAFFSGMSRADQIEKLTIEGTRILLLEMPFGPWTDSEILEVKKLIEERGFHIVLAHLERFMKMSANKKYINQLLQMPLHVQINAEGLLDWKQRRKLIKMFAKNEAHFLGSDCHGMHHRPPNLISGREVLEKKLGSGFLKQMDESGYQFLSESETNDSY